MGAQEIYRALSRISPEIIERNKRSLGAYWTWGIESEKAAEQGQVLTISPAHSVTRPQISVFGVLVHF